MKQILNFVLVFSFILTACSSMTTPPLVPTVTPIPVEPTFTKTLTPAPSKTPTETLTPVPTEMPIVSLESQPVAQESVSLFANAMQEAGINITVEQILQQGLLIQIITRKDGKQYEIATVHLDSDQNLKEKVLEGAYPLMIKNEGVWKKLNPNELQEIGSPIGITVDMGDPLWKSDPYQTAINDFGTFTAPGSATYQWGDSGKAAEYWLKITPKNIQFIWGPVFHHADTTPAIANKKEFDVFVDSRIAQVITGIKKYPGKNIGVFLGNEPFYFNEYNQSVKWTTNESNSSNKSFAPYKYYGENWLAEMYVRLMQAAEAKGLVIGVDFYPIAFQIDQSFLTHPEMAKYVLNDFIPEFKEYAATKLNKSPDDVKFIVSAEAHFVEKGQTSRWGTEIPTDKLDIATQRLIEINERLNQMGLSLMINELDCPGPNDGERSVIFEGMAKLAAQEGVPLLFWFGFGTQTNEFSLNAHLYDEKYKPTKNYYDFVRGYITFGSVILDMGFEDWARASRKDWRAVRIMPGFSFGHHSVA